MRNTNFIALLVLFMFTLFLGGWFRPRPKLATGPASVPTASLANQAAAPQTTTIAIAPLSLPLEKGVSSADPQKMEDRVAELESSALNDDDDSLRLILLALNDPNPEIRSAALDATIQFGSPDAIPTLQTAFAQSELPAEKIKFQEAIEFLALPPLALEVTNQP